MNDEDLRKRFGELKRADAAGAPAFDELVARRPRPRKKAPLFVAFAPVLAAAAVFLLWCGTRMNAEKRVASTAPVSAARPVMPIRVEAATELPLDFLLDDAPVTVHLDADPLRGMKP